MSNNNIAQRSPRPAGPGGNTVRFSQRLVRASLVSPVLLLLHIAAMAMFVHVIVRFVPDYMVIFEQRNALLPAPTIAVLRLSQLLTRFWYLLFVALLLVDGPILYGLQLLPRWFHWLSYVWFVIGLLLIVIAIVLTFFILSYTLELTE
jgi:hypothetical protein